ncbi:GNAT family N-acetyltransferase [Streptomyces parvus]|uniref:GNAT family N-acetyltransferase n=1 Tax=Streptomyces parvus TaxID=66428 RepID=UPI001238F41C|nr:GNAT family N-acetyltransferase [Streptomyces parvus]KAA6202287.1 GNAT family N-acetyltransferase [Streptomyces parvus]GGS42841.1 hypothetical protein GCM10010221_47480 [Streptomyces parvus]
MSTQDSKTFTVRAVRAHEAAAIASIDPIAVHGSLSRRAAVARWCREGLALVAEDASGLLGYGVREYTFFDQGFITMLMVAPRARGRGVGRSLLDAMANSCATPKLFTSVNASNQPMRRLLLSAGWHAVGLLHGLDEGDPEVFYLRPALDGSAPLL